MLLKSLIGITVVVAGLVFFLLSTIHADPVKQGTDAPITPAVDEEGKPFSLEETYKKGLTLVYFYPKADTPGCTAQACAMRNEWTDMQTLGIQVVGVSMDKPESQKAFKEKYKLPFPLLADSEGKVVAAFGVATIRVGFATRQSFLVKDGKIVWHDADVKPDTHLDNVKKAVAALNAPAAPAPSAAPKTT